MRGTKIFLVVLFLIVASGIVHAVHISADDVFGKLMDGNMRFIEGRPSAKDLSYARREELVKGQHPVATIISCSDSRVPPEVVFDQALGDIFIVRVAGNVVEPTILGSIEYGVEHLHTPLLVILGHEQCGAVKATMDAKGRAEGNIGVILKKIQPAVAAAKKANKDSLDVLDLAVKENVKNTYKDIMKSKIIRHLVHKGELKIIAAEYRLKSGKVEIIDLGNDHRHTH